MANKHTYTLNEMKTKRDRLAKQIRGIPGVESVGIGGDSLIVLLTHSGSEDRLPKEFEGCEVAICVVGKASAQ